MFDVKAREIYLDSGDFSDNYRLKPHLVTQKTKKMDIIGFFLYAFLIVFAAKYLFFDKLTNFVISWKNLIYIFKNDI